ncbi:WRKY transcription factor 44-like isoform X2 [Phragmites australis]|uniref:WRKY transcription factor 44-like isoform X2 n=1 Tax=Phragmites australis TaxID=29695 RepID=UPI002D78911B|nr:WRKY transcription factor 44-like isoform X2 [Phragmites australis]
MHRNHRLFLLSSTPFSPLHCFYQSAAATEHKTKRKMQGHEKIAALKPVASRPFSSFQTYSQLLKDFTAIGSAPITVLEETNLIRPKTTRFTSVPSDLPTEITATTDAGSGTTLEDMEVDTEQFVSFDHLTACHTIRKPMSSVKNRLSYDGYSWRKYGQKQVKGSEFPRSYYKCTHPSCLVKRKVEKTIDGQIAEIVYSGEHNHPKPHPPRNTLSLPSTEVVVVDLHGTNDAGLESQIGGRNRAPGTAVTASRGNYNCFDEVRKMSELTDNKKSTREKQSSNASSLTAYTEPTPASQTWTDCELSGDAFGWRKYGQKVVKGNSLPRSYYRCSAPRCNARKYVERAPHNHDSSGRSSSVTTTYQGRHNHDIIPSGSGRLLQG